jgi:hypothetical protein
MRRVAATLCAIGGLWLARAGYAQDAKPAPAPPTPPATPTTPDLDFLEYLGAWQETDEEWLVSEQWQKDHRAGAERKRAADKADGKKPGQARDDDESK